MKTLLKVVGITGLMLAGLLGFGLNMANGNPLDVSSSEIVVSENSNPNAYPATAYNQDQDEFLVVWNSQQANGYSIQGQRVSSNGILIDQNFTVTSGISTSILPDAPTVAYGSDRKEYLVIWSDESLHLHGQRVLSDGVLLGTSFVISTPLSSLPFRPALAYSPEYDEFLLTWRDCISATTVVASPLGGGACYFYTQILDGTGARLSDNITATNETYMQTAPAIAYVPEQDEYWIVWTEQARIAAQRILTTGLLSGNSFTITHGTAEILDPSISNVSTQGELLVTWADGRYSQYNHSPLGGGYHNIFAQRVLSTGVPLGDNFRVSSEVTSLEPKVTYLAERDQYVVAWTTIDFVNHDYNVYARWITAAGKPIGNDLAIAATLQNQLNPTVAGRNTAFILWDDSRGTPDIRGRLMQTPTWIYLPSVMRNSQ